MSTREGAHKDDEIVIFRVGHTPGAAIVRCTLAFILSNHVPRLPADRAIVARWSAIGAL